MLSLHHGRVFVCIIWAITCGQTLIGRSGQTGEVDGLSQDIRRYVEDHSRLLRAQIVEELQESKVHDQWRTRERLYRGLQSLTSRLFSLCSDHLCEAKLGCKLKSCGFKSHFVLMSLLWLVPDVLLRPPQQSCVAAHVEDWFLLCNIGDMLWVPWWENLWSLICSTYLHIHSFHFDTPPAGYRI